MVANVDELLKQTRKNVSLEVEIIKELNVFKEGLNSKIKRIHSLSTGIQELISELNRKPINPEIFRKNQINKFLSLLKELSSYLKNNLPKFVGGNKIFFTILPINGNNPIELALRNLDSLIITLDKSINYNSRAELEKIPGLIQKHLNSPLITLLTFVQQDINQREVLMQNLKKIEKAEEDLDK
jgi:hypothetical protein